MSYDDTIRFAFKADDRPTSTDPQDAAIRLSDVLRALADEAWRLRNLLTSDRANTATTRDQARTRSVELAALADQAITLAESASQHRRVTGRYAP